MLKNHTPFCLLLAFCKNGIMLLPREKTGPAKTGAAGPIPPALCYLLYIS